MAAVLPLLPERHRAAPQASPAVDTRSRGRGSLRGIAVLGQSTRSCISQRSAFFW